MRPRALRRLILSAHLVLGAVLGAVVYLPAAWTEPLRLLLGVLVVPGSALTGLVLWQGARLRRLLRRKGGPRS